MKMKKNNNFWIIMTVASVVILHILAGSKLFPPFWSSLLDVAASLVIVIAIAYVALGKHANICILSGAQRELAAKNQQVSSVNLLGGTKIYLEPGNDGVKVDVSLVNIMGGCDIFLPAGWRVEDHSVKVLGGVTDKRKNRASATGPTVRINGFLLLGGVTIKEKA